MTGGTPTATSPWAVAEQAELISVMLGVELPLAEVALDRLAAGLGVPHAAAGLRADHRAEQ